MYPPFRSRLRLVDRERRLLLLDRCTDEAANIALIALPRVDLQVEWGEWRIAFVAGNPAAFPHEGTVAIRLDFPDTVQIGRRRIYARTSDPRPPLHCVAQTGDTIVLEAEVSDVSMGGVGLELNFVADELEPGTIIKGCRLECPGWEPVTIDLEVRHTTMEPHGPRAVHVGCRFVNLSPAAMALVAEHVHAKRPGG